jgi:uncharacterized protein (TIGR00297 family)
MLMQTAIGAGLAALVSGLAWRLRALTAGGALAAFCIGTITFAAGGWPAAIVLFAFFAPSALLSRLGRARKRALVDVGKHGARDAWQVLANGGAAAACIALAPRFGAPLAAAFAGSFAAASADTWGTEIGAFARGRPRSILSFRPVHAGISGGISLIGTLAEIGGAAIVAIAAVLVHVAPLIAVLAGGVAGALVDSALGASLQALRHCPRCDRDCETDPHVCGTATTLIRGASWFGNDAVNLAATLTGAVVAGGLMLLR